MSSMGPESVKPRRGASSGGLSLSVGLTPNLRTRPILDGMFHADGIDMTCLELHPSELFWRQLKFAEFDVAEMSMSSMLMAIAGGDDRFIGLPIFTTHYFFQNWILVRKDWWVSLGQREPMYLRSSFIKGELKRIRRQQRLMDFDPQGLAVFVGKRRANVP